MGMVIRTTTNVAKHPPFNDKTWKDLKNNGWHFSGCQQVLICMHTKKPSERPSKCINLNVLKTEKEQHSQALIEQQTSLRKGPQNKRQTITDSIHQRQSAFYGIALLTSFYYQKVIHLEFFRHYTNFNMEIKFNQWTSGKKWCFFSNYKYRKMPNCLTVDN